MNTRTQLEIGTVLMIAGVVVGCGVALDQRSARLVPSLLSVPGICVAVVLAAFLALRGTPEGPLLVRLTGTLGAAWAATWGLVGFALYSAEGGGESVVWPLLGVFFGVTAGSIYGATAFWRFRTLPPSPISGAVTGGLAALVFAFASWLTELLSTRQIVRPVATNVGIGIAIFLALGALTGLISSVLARGAPAHK